jgi:hypothetical protein
MLGLGGSFGNVFRRFGEGNPLAAGADREPLRQGFCVGGDVAFATRS